VPQLQVGEVVDGPGRRLQRGVVRPAAEELAGDDPHLPVDPGDPPAVAAHRADGAGDVRAVVLVVGRHVGLVGIGGEVPAVDVVGVAVAVVILAVDRVEGVDPDVAGEVLVGVLDAGVDDADVDVGASGLAVVPGRIGLAAVAVDAGADAAVREAHVAVDTPVVILSVVGVGSVEGRLVRVEPVRLGEPDGGVTLQRGDRREDIGAPGQGGHLEAWGAARLGADGRLRQGAHPAARRAPLGLGRPLPVLDHLWWPVG
jgi:hypothetical protein